MPELRSLVRDEPEWLTLELGDDKVQVAYHPARVTPLWLSQAVEADDPLALSNMLASVISDWDVVDEGRPFPPSADNLAGLPLKLLVVLAEAFGDTATWSAEGNASSESTDASPPASTTPNSTVTRRNGTATSPLPASIG